MMNRNARKPQVEPGTLLAKAVIRDMLATRPMAVVTKMTAYLGIPPKAAWILGIPYKDVASHGKDLGKVGKLKDITRLFPNLKSGGWSRLPFGLQLKLAMEFRP